MKKLVASAAILAGLCAPLAAAAADDEGADDRSQHAITLAVFGDWPYSTILLDSARFLIDSVNADPRVRLVLHVGDIHSGSMPCTGAGLAPLPAGANEWTDCHKTKEFSSGAPLNELAAVRALFFAQPGTTLGVEKRRVASQA